MPKLQSHNSVFQTYQHKTIRYCIRSYSYASPKATSDDRETTIGCNLFHVVHRKIHRHLGVIILNLGHCTKLFMNEHYNDAYFSVLIILVDAATFEYDCINFFPRISNIQGTFCGYIKSASFLREDSFAP
jgi:hypothetical protein